MSLIASRAAYWQRWVSLVVGVWVGATVLGHAVFSPPLSLLASAQAGSVGYVYDDLGRLIAVVDVAAGDAAIYQYDAVGNLLGITRQPTSTVAILNFTPKSGPVGTTVVISGIGFSATATQNTVTFNGTAATVTAASETQLTVTVPGGATTGLIGVTTPSGSAFKHPVHRNDRGHSGRPDHHGLHACDGCGRNAGDHQRGEL